MTKGTVGRSRALSESALIAFNQEDYHDERELSTNPSMPENPQQEETFPDERSCCIECGDVGYGLLAAAFT